MTASQRPAPLAPAARVPVLMGLVLVLLCAHFALLRVGLIVRTFTPDTGATPSDLMSGFVTGFRFDLATACYLVAPFALIGCVPPLRFDRNRAARRLVYWTFLALMSCLTFLCLAEYEFFNEFQTRYNQVAVQYLDQPRTIVGMAWYNSTPSSATCSRGGC